MQYWQKGSENLFLFVFSLFNLVRPAVYIRLCTMDALSQVKERVEACAMKGGCID